MLRDLRTGLVLFLLLGLLTGLAYPMAVLGLGQSLFPRQANGSLVKQGGEIIGSSLIGQNFSSPAYFHSRPSAAGNGYDAGNSSGSNLAPTSADLRQAVRARITAIREEGWQSPIPADMVTASGSGLDPDISLANARVQLPRVAAARHVPTPLITNLIEKATEPPAFGLLGEQRINVLALNQALDRELPLEAAKAKTPKTRAPASP